MSDHPTLAELDGRSVRRPSHRPATRRRRSDARAPRLRLARGADGGRRARRHPRRPRARPAGGRSSEEAAAASCARSPRRNRPAEPMIGLGYHGTVTPAGDPAQRARGPDLVHRLHAVPAGDLPGPARGAAQLPDHGRRPDRAADRQRLAARRGHRRRRGDDAGAPRATARRPGPFVVDADALPQTIDVVRTRAEAMGIEVVVADLADGLPEGDALRRAACSTPAPPAGSSTRAGSSRRSTSATALAVVAADLLALTLLESPGDARRRRRRRLHPALRRPAVLRRPARRLHVGPRRPRAAPARPAGRRLGRRRGPAGVPPGPADPRAAHPPRQGDLQHLHRAGAARRRRRRCTPSTTAPRVCARSRCAPTGYAAVLAAALREAGVEVVHDAFFDTVPARVPGPGRGGRRRRPRRAACTCGWSTPTTSGITTSERPTRGAPRGGPRRVRRRRGRAGRRRRPHRRRAAGRPAPDARRTSPTRSSTRHRSETSMLRYLRRLSARDYALDRGMIPLGSCTMKLNATTEMEPISLPGFADLHPFAPAEDAAGYRAAGRPAGGLAGRGHRLRPGLDPAQRRLAGRAGRAARDPRLPPGQRRGRARRLPDPVLGARHQRRLRGDGRACGSSW